MDKGDSFQTQKGYELASTNCLTSAMEDYLEMICRLTQQEESTRIHILAKKLSVKPSSASKMVGHLKELGYVHAARYGKITLTEQGACYGSYLLYRHELLNRFLCFVNGSPGELEQTERIEHFIDERTIANLAKLMQRLTVQSVDESAVK